MADHYRDLSADYHWIFPDEIVNHPGVIGGTSAGSRAQRYAIAATAG
ncbi:hypothetical protein [Nonomuraea helvata]|uniref:Uncharacterized protein n=1 Tax=Nonomuraea helvata TaxID=37484 RepID=A0ABV5SH92_9ACTN